MTSSPSLQFYYSALVRCDHCRLRDCVVNLHSSNKNVSIYLCAICIDKLQRMGQLLFRDDEEPA